jgi:hypothetical protein
MHEMLSGNREPSRNPSQNTPRIVSKAKTQAVRPVCFLKTPMAHRPIVDVLDGFRFNGEFIMRDIVLVGYGRSQVFQTKCLFCGKLQFPKDFCPLCDECILLAIEKDLMKLLKKTAVAYHQLSRCR